MNEAATSEAKTNPKDPALSTREVDKPGTEEKPAASPEEPLHIHTSLICDLFAKYSDKSSNKVARTSIKPLVQDFFTALQLPPIELPALSKSLYVTARHRQGRIRCRGNLSSVTAGRFGSARIV